MKLDNFTLRTPEDDGDRKLLADVMEHGWHVIHIPADDAGPGFTFTVGLYYTFGHPELLIMGLGQNTAHNALACAVEEIRGGMIFSAGATTSSLLEGMPCRMSEIKAANYREYLGYGMWFYRSLIRIFPALQILWPDKAGKFPDDIEYSEDYLTIQNLI